jgi:acetyl-CoA C-acetyltransferase
MGVPVIVGIHEIARRTIPDLRLIDVFEEAARGAMIDAGLAANDIDGLFVSNLPGLAPAFTLAQHLGIEPRWSDTTRIGGAAPIAHVMHAAAAIRAGRVRAALIVYGSLSRSQRIEIGTGDLMREAGAAEQEWVGATITSRYAMFARRHMHDYGTTLEQLAAPTVASRRWAQLNADAIRREPTSIDDVLRSRIVATPLTAAMCCVISDGGGAVIVADAAVATDASTRPVQILGAGEQMAHGGDRQDRTHSAVRSAAQAAFGEAGVGPNEMDLCTVYDSFTITVIAALEDAGFCAKGDGGQFVEDGRLGPGGALPTNPDGGGLSANHPGMRGIFLVIELVRQLRQEAGGRQVADARLGVAIGVGGTLDDRHASSVLVLGT